MSTGTVSRRNLTKGVAWSAPVIVSTAAIPAYAASRSSNLRAESITGPGVSGVGFRCNKPCYEGSQQIVKEYSKASWVTFTGTWVSNVVNSVPPGVTLRVEYLTQDYYEQVEFVSATLDGRELKYIGLQYTFRNCTEGSATSTRVTFNDGEVDQGQNPVLVLITDEAIPVGSQVVIVYRVKFRKESGWNAAEN